MAGAKWSDLSPRTQRLIIIGAAVETSLKAAALVDSVRVAPEKPAKAGARATPGVPSAISSIFLTTAVVRASDAPPGNWTETTT